jgi:dipeptidyl aminopeptidase/acylaminoacyl peptidase
VLAPVATAWAPAFFYLDRVNAPLLIEYGSTDYLSPFSVSMFTALRRLGKRVELVRYNGEDHVIFERANEIDYWRRAIAWFDAYLGVASPAHER